MRNSCRFDADENSFFPLAIRIPSSVHRVGLMLLMAV